MRIVGGRTVTSVFISQVHHIFTRGDIAEIINLQPKGNEAKAYQVKQIRNIIVKHISSIVPRKSIIVNPYSGVDSVRNHLFGIGHSVFLVDLSGDF